VDDGRGDFNASCFPAVSAPPCSVALEAEFWAVIDASAQKDGIALAALVARIDASRGERPLASALRLFALDAKGG
jgi:predicted DNA-binding ribbon-helix-helix protein